MKAKGWGSVVNITSIYSMFATVNRIDYITTKTAPTRPAALEVAVATSPATRSVRARC